MDNAMTILNALSFCGSYTLIFSQFLENKKSVKYFFALILLVELYCKLWRPELIGISFYICCGIATVFLGREQYILLGLNNAIGILKLLVWIVAFIGSSIFLCFPETEMSNNKTYNLIMAASLLIFSVFVRMKSSFFFNKDASRKLMRIDAALSLIFVLYINILLPKFFLDLGRVNYAKICFAILAYAAVTLSHKKYTLRLELEAETDRLNRHYVNKRAAYTVLKAQEAIELKRKYLGTEQALCDINNSEQIKKISIPVVQSTLYELMDIANGHGLTLTLEVDKGEPMNQDSTSVIAILDVFLANTKRVLEAKYDTNTIHASASAMTDGFSLTIALDNLDDVEAYGVEIVKSAVRQTVKRHGSDIKVKIAVENNVFVQMMDYRGKSA